MTNGWTRTWALPRYPCAKLRNTAYCNLINGVIVAQNNCLLLMPFIVNHIHQIVKVRRSSLLLHNVIVTGVIVTPLLPANFLPQFRPIYTPYPSNVINGHSFSPRVSVKENIVPIRTVNPVFSNRNITVKRPRLDPTNIVSPFSQKMR